MDGQMDIFDFEEKYCKTCKHAYKRSDFDLELHWKLAYTLRCGLDEECRQLYDKCESWESKEAMMNET